MFATPGRGRRARRRVPRRVLLGDDLARDVGRIGAVRLVHVDPPEAPAARHLRGTHAAEHATLRMQLQPGTCPSPVLGFWGKMTMPNAGIMAYRRDLPSTTRI